MRKLTTDEIAVAVSGTVTGKNTEITSICTDTRKITEGCLFFALVGENFDGHDFAQKAAELGAAAIVCHKRVECDCTVINVFDTRAALLDLAGYYRRLFDIPLIALTGSVGKTTTKEMTYDVISKKYKTLKNFENLNNEVGLPITVFNLDETFEAAVLEMGMNHFGEISRLSRAAKPTMAIMSNIGVAHLENLGSQENILKAKLEILEGLTENAPVILNGDDKFLSGAKISDHPVYYYGIENDECAVKAVNIKEDKLETRFTVLYKEEKTDVVLPTVGIHNVYNALAAFTAGMLMGVDAKSAAEALSEYKPAGMRQRVNVRSGLTVIEDCYNANPDSMKASLKIMSNMDCRKIAVLGDMLELGEISEEAHRDIGKSVAENKVDYLFTFGEMSKLMAEEAKKNGVEAYSFDDKSELTDLLLKTVKENDCILFKASRGMKLEEVLHALYEKF